MLTTWCSTPMKPPAGPCWPQGPQTETRSKASTAAQCLISSPMRGFRQPEMTAVENIGDVALQFIATYQDLWYGFIHIYTTVKLMGSFGNAEFLGYPMFHTNPQVAPEPGLNAPRIFSLNTFTVLIGTWRKTWEYGIYSKDLKRAIHKTESSEKCKCCWQCYCSSVAFPRDCSIQCEMYRQYTASLLAKTSVGCTKLQRRDWRNVAQVIPPQTYPELPWPSNACAVAKRKVFVLGGMWFLI